MARIGSLDGVRGLAAFAVVLHHAMQTIRRDNDLTGADWDLWLHRWPLRLPWAGDEAVIAFFVLSGFVLTLPFLGAQRPSWPRFALRRFVRLYPPYFMALLIASLTAWMLASGRSPRLAQVFGPQWHGDLGFGTFMNSVVMLNEVQPTNGVLWSIVQEMRVSLVFPLLFLFTVRIGTVAALLISLLLAAGVAFGASEWRWFDGLGPTPISYIRTLLYFFFFVLGIALAQHREAIRHTLAGRWRDMQLALAILGLGACGSYYVLPFGWGALATGVGFATILAVTLSNEWATAFFEAGIPRFLGRISFSLYLVHAPVIFALLCLLEERLSIPLIVVVAVPASLLAAWGFWFVIERPSIHWSRQVTLVPR